MSDLRRWHWFVRRQALEAGFRVVYPLLARLPAGVGQLGAALWGRLMAQLDCDWRSVALKEHFVAARTAATLAEMQPGFEQKALRKQIRDRFVAACQEELEGHWLAYGLKAKRPVEIEGLEPLRAAIAKGRGLLLLTFHYDAAIWGIGCLGRAGLRLSPMSSAIVEDTRVPPVVRHYFARKYEGLNRYLNGGRVMHSETSLREFYRRLQLGEGVVILADAPACDEENALVAPFLGKPRAFAGGAARLARKTGAVVAAFVCLRNQGRYRLVISPPYGVQEDADNACRAALAFLEEHVQACPQRWWAADLLPPVLPRSASLFRGEDVRALSKT